MIDFGESPAQFESPRAAEEIHVRKARLDPQPLACGVSQREIPPPGVLFVDGNQDRHVGRLPIDARRFDSYGLEQLERAELLL